MRNKKAALELSVTAIVVLILAIVMLALGIGFIRGMFTKAAGSFEDIISAEPDPSTASAADVMTLSRTTIITTAGASEVLKVSVYNPTRLDWNGLKADGTKILCDGATLSTCVAQGCTWVAGAAGAAGSCTADTSIGVAPLVTCNGFPAAPVFNHDTDIKVNPKSIDAGKSATFGVLIDIPDSDPASVLCEIKVDKYSEDFTIQIK